MLSRQNVLVGVILTSIGAALGCAVQSAVDAPQTSGGGAQGSNDGAGTGGASASGAASAGAGALASGGSVGSAGGTAAGGTAAGGTAAGGTAAGGTASAGAGAAGSSGAATGRGGAPSTGPVSATLPFTEDFESGMIDHQRWLAVADQVLDGTWGGWSVVTNDTGKAAQLSADGTERFLEGGNGAWTDQKLELRVQAVSGSPEIDVLVRYHAVKEYYYLSFAKSTFKIRDRTGANADLQPASKPTQALGKWYKLTFVVKGTTLSASLDDALLITGSFPSMPIAAGGVAIGVRTGSGVAQFDDIHVSLP